jgi:acyl-CoA reductase-like NAD-dependent aldehyde dehydrogenase
MNRLPINKTPKVYVGGAFIRSESGRVFPVQSKDGKFLANLPQCTRKDLRNAVEAAAKAGPGWAKRTPYNRGQILYRLAEMMETRSAELAEAIALGRDGEAARNEVNAAIDRVVYFAGWADKYEQVLGNVNPVAAPYFNFTITEPMGVVGLIAPAEMPLLGLVSLFAPVIVSGNVVVALASEASPFVATVLGEMLATSDLPGGVVNLLTGFHKELLPTFATHEHIRGLSGVVSPEERRELEIGAAESIKRVHLHSPSQPPDWYSDVWESVYPIRDFVELKTVWHPIGA